ncbi:MAG: hypothetical protein BIFFINMI_02843 [Phycisphaerae bacterium]|nr:hypothetical protein [Phycisphaerae bacterium]
MVRTALVILLSALLPVATGCMWDWNSPDNRTGDEQRMVYPSDPTPGEATRFVAVHDDDTVSDQIDAVGQPGEPVLQAPRVTAQPILPAGGVVQPQPGSEGVLIEAPPEDGAQPQDNPTTAPDRP